MNNQLIDAANLAHKFSIEKYLIRDYPIAIKYALKEIEIFKLLNVKDSNYVNALYNLAYFYTENEQYELSTETFRFLIDEKLNDVMVARSYGSIGQNYQFQGNYQKAIEYISESINRLKELKDYRSILTQKIILTNVYLRLEDSTYAVKGLEVADQIQKLKNKIEFNDELEASLNKIYGNFYNVLGEKNFDKAKYFYNRNLSINKRNNDSLSLGGVYSSLSSLYNKKEKDSAGYFGIKAISLLKGNLNSLSTAYINYVDYLIRIKDFTNSIEQLDRILLTSFDRSSPSREILFNLSNKYQVLLLLSQKIESYFGLFNSSKNISILEKIVSTTQLSDELSQILMNSTSDFSTKLYWLKKLSKVYLNAAYASHLLGDSEKAFEFMEKNKALLLSESVLKNTEFANLPKHISDEETKRQKLIYNLESKLSANSDYTILQDSLFNAKRSHEKYVDSLKSIYPKYFARKINVEHIPLDQVKKNMNSNEALISYIWNDFDRNKQLVVGLVSTKEDTKTFTIENVDVLQKNIKKYQRLISEPFSTVKDQEDFQKVAHELYLQLFPTDEIRELVENKNLMIIADGLLQNIPFESLITEENTNNYLILQADLHYSYSYSFLKHNQKVNRRSDKTFIGYSPTKFNDSTLVPLKFSKSEVESILSEFNGIVKLNENATKSDFMRNSSDVKIIHLATHADAGDYPWIAFEDKKMELHELYTYKNNAELVTLSACNTSLGEMAEGEGVISLARGFFHSGSKSVVSSLWRVNDESTSEIMTSFYQYLKEGQQKSEALSNSKRDYIKNHSLSEQSPYYWSSFVLIGDPGEIKIDSQNHLYYTLLLLVIPVGLLIRKKLKKAG